jgi:transcriptional regulator with XRE-family HTH domain
MAKVELNTNKEWLLRNAAEDDGGAVSVGGLAQMLGLLEPPHLVESAAKTAFARLIELRRRERGLSLETLAAKADVDLAAVLAIEQDIDVVPEPRIVLQLAQVLDLPPQRLLQLSGLSQSQDASLEKAAVRFAARSQPVDELSAQEHDALNELVKVICEG